jgi:hypothetical protein
MNNTLISFLLSLFCGLTFLVTISVIQKTIYKKRFEKKIDDSIIQLKAGVFYKGFYHSMYETRIEIGRNIVTIIYCNTKLITFQKYRSIKIFDFLVLSGVKLELESEDISIYCHATQILMKILVSRLILLTGEQRQT